MKRGAFWVVVVMILLTVWGGCVAVQTVPSESAVSEVGVVTPGIYEGWRGRRLILSSDAGKTEAPVRVDVWEDGTLRYTRKEAENIPPIDYIVSYEKIEGGCIRWNSGRTKDILVMCPPDNINKDSFKGWSEVDRYKIFFFKRVSSNPPDK
jgi:hypothetical protein